jgi:hypothetical protein
MIHPSTTNNIDTATTTATTTNITKKKKEYEKQLIEIGEFYQNLILSIQPPSHDLNFKQEKITFQLLVSSNNDEPLESAIGVSSMIEKEKSDDDHEKNDDDDDEKDDDDDDDDDIEVDPVIDVDMVDVDTTTNSNDKNVEVKKIKSSSAYKKTLLSITTPTTPTTNENSTFITTNKNKTTKSILRDVTTPPKLSTTSPSLPSQKHSPRMSDITMNTTTIQQQQQQPLTRSMKSKFNTMAAAAAITTTSPLPKISFPNIKLTKSSIHTIKGKPSTPIKSRRMSELTVTFSNIDGDHGSVYSNSTTTSTIINTNENKNIYNYKNKNNDNIMSSIKNDHKIKLKRIAKKKIISLPSTDLHLSTAMMRVWYANNKTADDMTNNNKN